MSELPRIFLLNFEFIAKGPADYPSLYVFLRRKVYLRRRLHELGCSMDDRIATLLFIHSLSRDYRRCYENLLALLSAGIRLQWSVLLDWMLSNIVQGRELDHNMEILLYL